MDTATIDWAQGCTRFDNVQNSEKHILMKKVFIVILTGKYDKVFQTIKTLSFNILD